MKNFFAHTDEIRQEMLKEISCSSIEDLFKQIPVKIENFNISNHLSDSSMNVRKSSTNLSSYV